MLQHLLERNMVVTLVTQKEFNRVVPLSQVRRHSGELSHIKGNLPEKERMPFPFCLWYLIGI